MYTFNVTSKTTVYESWILTQITFVVFLIFMSCLKMSFEVSFYTKTFQTSTALMWFQIFEVNFTNMCVKVSFSPKWSAANLTLVWLHFSMNHFDVGFEIFYWNTKITLLYCFWIGNQTPISFDKAFQNTTEQICYRLFVDVTTCFFQF
jgi:hypothetical protein